MPASASTVVRHELKANLARRRPEPAGCPAEVTAHDAVLRVLQRPVEEGARGFVRAREAIPRRRRQRRGVRPAEAPPRKGLRVRDAGSLDAPDEGVRAETLKGGVAIGSSLCTYSERQNANFGPVCALNSERQNATLGVVGAV